VVNFEDCKITCLCNPIPDIALSNNGCESVADIGQRQREGGPRIRDPGLIEEMSNSYIPENPGEPASDLTTPPFVSIYPVVLEPLTYSTEASSEATKLNVAPKVGPAIYSAYTGAKILTILINFISYVPLIISMNE
jgi:hypothetical protein